MNFLNDLNEFLDVIFLIVNPIPTIILFFIGFSFFFVLIFFTFLSFFFFKDDENLKNYGEIEMIPNMNRVEPVISKICYESVSFKNVPIKTNKKKPVLIDLVTINRNGVYFYFFDSHSKGTLTGILNDKMLMNGKKQVNNPILSKKDFINNLSQALMIKENQVYSVFIYDKLDVSSVDGFGVFSSISDSIKSINNQKECFSLDDIYLIEDRFPILKRLIINEN